MDGLEDKLGNILNNPQMMQQIMSLAQSLNQPGAQNDPPKQQLPKNPGSAEVSAMSRITGIVNRGNLDQEQRSLLNALSPYLSKEKIGKLERAMKAEKMARMASSFLNAGGLQMLTGR